MRRSTKKNIRTFTIILVLATLLVFTLQQFTFVDTQFFGITRCDKESGCTTQDIALCNMETADLEASEGYVCTDSCFVRCSDSSEMRRLNENYDIKCDTFSGAGALVEVVSRCSLVEAKSHDKTVCSNGNTHVFTAGSGYPQEEQFENWDVYWMTSDDQLEERKQSCSYACRQYSDKSAQCIDSPEDENAYTAQDHKDCFAFSGRWEVWWFDSDNKINTRIEVCDETCLNGECQFEDIIIDDITPDDSLQEPQCAFGSCTDKINVQCADGSSIIAYDCIDSCAVPVSNSCPDGSIPVSSCKEYEQLDPTTYECGLSFERLASTDGIKSYTSEHPIIIASIIGGLLVIIVFTFTASNNYKRRR